MSISTFKPSSEPLKIETNNLRSAYKHIAEKVNCWLKWLAPGLCLKRWFLVSFTGILLTILGLAMWLKLTLIYRLLVLVSHLLAAVTQIIPSSVLGTIAIALGLFLTFWGQTRAISSITEALKPEGNEELVDILLARRRLNRGPKIVAIGGGTGLSSLLRGLKHYSTNLTAIVTVADDGGSSGRLRREIGVLPPGDIRNCITALAKEENLLTELFQYRFQAGDGLTGHSFGNLFLTAMSEITGDLERAIVASSKVLAVQGRVLPATLSDVRLWAELDQGQRIEGESKITETQGQINKIGCIPANPPALPAALKAIEEADYIIIGPGSLYTSVIPNLLVPEIREAIAKAKVPRIYVCNIMTQPGETEGYSVSDHIRAIDRACGQRLFDAVLVQGKVPSSESLMHYAQENSHPVLCDREDISRLGRKVIVANVMDESQQTACVRHDSQKLAKVLLKCYANKWQSTSLEPEQLRQLKKARFIEVFKSMRLRLQSGVVE